MVVLDTYAWVEYFRGTEKGLVVKELLEKENVITPSIVLAELARKYKREGFSTTEIAKRLYFIVSVTEVEGISVEVALKASELYIKLHKISKEKKLRTPSLADAIVYAIALIKNDKLVTGDKLFKGLEAVIYIGD